MFPPARTVRVDFSKNGKSPPRKNRLRRLFVMLRKLIRRRQESDLVRQVRLEMLKALDLANSLLVDTREKAARELAESRNDFSHEIAALKKRLDDRDEQISNLKDRLERQKADYDEMIRSRDKQIFDLAEVKIPVLEGKLEVERAHGEHLALLVQKKRKHEEAEIALDNLRIAAAENSQAQIPVAGTRLSGERSL